LLEKKKDKIAGKEKEPIDVSDYFGHFTYKPIGVENDCTQGDEPFKVM